MSKTGASFLVNFAVAAGLLYVFRTVLWPFALALVLAILIMSLSDRVVRLMPKARPWMVFAVTAVIVGSVIVFSMAVVIEGASQIVERIPAMLARIDQLLALIHPPGGGTLSLEALTQKVELGPVADQLLTSVQDATAGLGLTLIYLFFLLISKPMIEKRVEQIVASRGPCPASSPPSAKFSVFRSCQKRIGMCRGPTLSDVRSIAL